MSPAGRMPCRPTRNLSSPGPLVEQSVCQSRNVRLKLAYSDGHGVIQPNPERLPSSRGTLVAVAARLESNTEHCGTQLSEKVFTICGLFHRHHGDPTPSERRTRKSPNPQRQCSFSEANRDEGQMLGLEDFMTIRALVKRGVCLCGIAEQLGAHPRTVRRAVKRNGPPAPRQPVGSVLGGARQAPGRGSVERRGDLARAAGPGLSRGDFHHSRLSPPDARTAEQRPLLATTGFRPGRFRLWYSARSSRTGTSPTEPKTRRATKIRSRLTSGGPELRAEPTMTLSNTQWLRYAGQSSSGATQSANAAMPMPMRPAQLPARNEISWREHTSSTVPTRATGAQRGGWARPAPSAPSATKTMNVANGATQGAARLLRKIPETPRAPRVARRPWRSWRKGTLLAEVEPPPVEQAQPKQGGSEQ